MATRKKVELPGTVFIYREKDGDDSYLVVWETLEEAVEGSEKGTLVGTYDLTHSGKYSITKSVKED